MEHTKPSKTGLANCDFCHMALKSSTRNTYREIIDLARAKKTARSADPSILLLSLDARASMWNEKTKAKRKLSGNQKALKVYAARSLAQWQKEKEIRIHDYSFNCFSSQIKMG